MIILFKKYGVFFFKITHLSLDFRFKMEYQSVMLKENGVFYTQINLRFPFLNGIQLLLFMKITVIYLCVFQT